MRPDGSGTPVADGLQPAENPRAGYFCGSGDGERCRPSTCRNRLFHPPRSHGLAVTPERYYVTGGNGIHIYDRADGNWSKSLPAIGGHAFFAARIHSGTGRFRILDLGYLEAGSGEMAAQERNPRIRTGGQASAAGFGAGGTRSFARILRGHADARNRRRAIRTITTECQTCKTTDLCLFETASQKSDSSLRPAFASYSGTARKRTSIRRSAEIRMRPDSRGLIHMASPEDYTSENHIIMLQDDEPESIFLDPAQRSFDPPAGRFRSP